MGGNAPQAGQLAIAAHGRWKNLVRPSNSYFEKKAGVWRPNPETHPPDKLWFKHDVKSEGPREDIPLHERKIWIPTKNAMLVPANEGFEEMYYWDSLLIVKGVLRSPEPEIRALAKGTADNLIGLVEQFGFVPNSNMPPYLTRSQPPVLAMIVEEVLEKHGWRGEAERLEWLRGAVAALEKEYGFWTSGRRITDTGLSRYSDNVFDEPHLLVVFEVLDANYLRDMDANDPNWLYATGSKRGTGKWGAFLKILQQDDQFHSRAFEPGNLTVAEKSSIVHRRAACESGWDYSMRWRPDGKNEYGRAEDINPVDLNSLLAVYERNLQKFNELLGEPKEAQYWGECFEKRKELMNQLLYDKESGFYYDYDMGEGRKGLTKFPSLASYLPLWAGIAEGGQAAAVAGNLKMFRREYGLATTLEKNSEWQWDGDRGWAPLHYFAVEGLMKYGFVQEALEIAGAWLKGIGIIFEKHRVFPEKMNVSSPLDTKSGLMMNEGRYGTKGTEDAGFGWTNALVVLFENLLSERK